VHESTATPRPISGYDHPGRWPHPVSPQGPRLQTSGLRCQCICSSPERSSNPKHLLFRPIIVGIHQSFSDHQSIVYSRKSSLYRLLNTEWLTSSNPPLGEFLPVLEMKLTPPIRHLAFVRKYSSSPRYGSLIRPFSVILGSPNELRLPRRHDRRPLIQNLLARTRLSHLSRVGGPETNLIACAGPPSLKPSLS